MKANSCDFDRNHPSFLEFAQKGDDRGRLVVIEELEDIPFEIKRIFYIYGTEGDVVRGRHANKLSEFVLVNVMGSSKVRTLEKDGTETVFTLDRPHTGIYIPRGVWKDMYDFSEDSVLLVMASTHYDASEYIRDYDSFIDAS